jgi:tetratricopeptide (TPR) repeat protein
MEKSPPSPVRILTAFLILLLAVSALYPLSVRLLSQLHLSSAGKSIAALQYTAALGELRKAVGLEPNNFRVHNELGNIYYKLGNKDQESSNGLQLLEKAKEHFQEALRLHPLDARSAYGLARTEILIEKINYLSGKGSPPLNKAPAKSALEQAIALRPASTIYRLAYARYLYLYDESDKLLAEMSNLGRLQPSLYGALRGESFWSPAARQEFFSGVEQAIAQGITPRQSLLAASELMAEEKNWPQAINFRQQGMSVQSSLNRASDFIRQGSFYLMADEQDQALVHFFQALAVSNDIEKDIITIMQVCKYADSPDSLIVFYGRAGKLYGNSANMDIAAARYLFDLKKYEQAKTVLQEANTLSQDGDAYYWLSRIAEAEQDWDALELMIQKATLHDPQNARYHLRFSQVLRRLQKYERAEKEAGLAIDYTDNVSAGLYHHRAALRMRINDHKGALEDWLQALTIDPGKASFYFHAGDAAEKMGRVDEAAGYYLKAMELEPANKTYTQSLERLDKKYGVKR